MRKGNSRTDAEAERHLDALLHVAAEYEPESQAPAGLAMRAMLKVTPRRATFSIPAMAGAAATVVLIALLAWRLVPAIPVPPSGPGTGGERQHGGYTEQLVKPEARVVDSGGAPAVAVSEPVRPAPVTKRAKRHVARRSKAPSPPRVRLREHVVRRYAAGIIAPVWIAHDDGTGAGLVLQRGVVTLSGPKSVRLASNDGQPDCVVLAPMNGGN
jgi:hypothetical protein